ncbi:MAG: DAK2 domain-containing protein [Limnochordia bacterium]
MERLTAELFRTMTHAAAERLEAEKARLDALNVFPVADGDTGTNMALTLRAAAEAVLQISDSDSLGELTESAAQGALMGARGNSGVILSQFLRGFADGIGSRKTAAPIEVAQALVSASQAGYGAVVNPVEGTMLTVGREAADTAVRIAEEGGNLQEVLEGALAAACVSLANTPNLLAALREAGVVDAGGEGLVVAARGAYEVFNGKPAPSVVGSSSETISLTPDDQDTETGESLTESSDSDITYRYCTEFVIRGVGIDRRTVKKDLSDLGDSLLVVGHDELVKIHIHTNHPGLVLELCGVRGQLFNIHIDNMEEQTRLAAEKRAPKASDLTVEEDRPPVEIAVIAVAAGGGCIELLKSLGATSVIEGGQTMNPSTQEILNAIQHSNAKAALVLPNNKNVLMSARQAGHLASIPVTVVPTRSFCEGIAALLRFSPEAGLDDNAKQMEAAIDDITCAEVTRAVRDARVDSTEVKEGDYLGISNGKILVTGTDRQEVVQQLMAALMETNEDGSLATIYYGEDVEEDEAHRLARLLQESLDLDVEVYRGEQPVYDYLLSVE